MRRLEKERDNYRHLYEKEKYQNSLQQQQQHQHSSSQPPPTSSADMSSGGAQATNSNGMPPNNGPHHHHPGHLGDHLVDLRLTATTPGGPSGNEEYNKRVAYASLAAAATNEKTLSLATLR